MSFPGTQHDGLKIKQLDDAVQPDVAQRRASDPTTSVWVGASAGSGKTKVLADRVLRLLLEGVAPQRILCLTFTRAAAAEMSIRITQRLVHWATCSDDELSDELHRLQAPSDPNPDENAVARRLFARVLACPGGMRIRTLHAFGQEVLRRFPLEAGLSPHFGVLEEADAQALWHEAQSDLLQAAAMEPNSPEGRALQILVRELGEDSFTSLLHETSRDTQRLAEALDKAGGLTPLIASMRGLLDLGPEDSEVTLRRNAMEDRVLPRSRLLPVARQLAEKGSKKYKARGQAMLGILALPASSRAESFEIYSRAFLTAEGEPFKDAANKELLTEHPEIEDIIRQEATRLTVIVERLDSVRRAEQTAAILTLAVALRENYAARKTGQAALDYDDLIRRTNELLHRPGKAAWVLFKLDGGLDHILVDEAQDTSPEQWRIVVALTEEFLSGFGSHAERQRTVFVVGDEKQSIFGFRGADPDDFMRMRSFFRERITAAEQQYREEPMNISFRSAPAVLKAVDAVFANGDARRGVSLDVVQHIPFRREAAGRVEVWPLLTALKDETADDDVWTRTMDFEPEHDPAVALAEQIAGQIKKWVCDGEEVFDRTSHQNKPMTPGDVMVLVRRRDKFVYHLVRQLKERGVPVTGIDRMKLTEQLAVMDLTALMQFVLLPEDDLTLATVLRGPLMGCSEEQLMALAIGRKGTLWQSLLDKSEEEEVYVPLRDYLQRALAAADKITPYAFLARLLSEPCPADGVSGKRAMGVRLGPDAQDPIDELLNAAQDFSLRHTPSLQAFLHWLMATDVEIKREMDQSAGRVRITTVHAAKGLEAPVVILPDTVSVPRKQEMPKFLWHPEHRLPLYVPREPRQGIVLRLYEAARQKQLEEYRRLLYVALTRAADRLYIGGWGESTEESWYGLISKALQPLHESSALLKTGDVTPIIVLADPAFPKGEAKKEKVIRRPMVPMPDWIYRPPPSEPMPPRPLTPSRATEAEPPSASPQGDRFARGRILHRLLQSLPDVEAVQQEKVAARFLANPQHGLTSNTQAELVREVLTLLRHPDYGALFGPGSRAEVPIVGRVEGRLIAGQVDRLCVRGGEVWIIDYKTNRPPPEKDADIPRLYRDQLKAYGAVLREIYPGKTVRGFLLWTYGPTLMAVPEEISSSS